MSTEQMLPTEMLMKDAKNVVFLTYLFFKPLTLLAMVGGVMLFVYYMATYEPHWGDALGIAVIGYIVLQLIYYIPSVIQWLISVFVIVPAFFYCVITFGGVYETYVEAKTLYHHDISGPISEEPLVKEFNVPCHWNDCSGSYTHKIEMHEKRTLVHQYFGGEYKGSWLMMNDDFRAVVENQMKEYDPEVHGMKSYTHHLNVALNHTETNFMSDDIK